jgi:ribosomal protein S18 acetylase RimI-like enzyme
MLLIVGIYNIYLTNIIIFIRVLSKHLNKHWKPFKRRKTMNLKIVELTPQDLDYAANFIAAAFFDNPAHIYIFPESHNRFKALQWMLGANLKLNLSPQQNIGQSFALIEPHQPPGKRQIKAMGFWNPPNANSVSFLSLVKAGLLAMPFRFGWGSLPNLLEVMKANAIAKKQALNGTPAWYLNNMVVASELRGQGVGTKVLAEQLERLVEPSGFPAILDTQREINVKFYQRLGFKVASKSIVGKGQNAFVNWYLIR